MKIYLGLVHHPIVNKRNELITTSVTNLDIHDISRSCRTFGICEYHIITPLEIQKELVEKILGHWGVDGNVVYNPDRSDALSKTYVKSSIEESLNSIEEIEGQRPFLAVTGANFKENFYSETALRNQLEIDKRPCLLIFGTGWGLHASVVDAADFKLAPLYGDAKDGYNHLSVRSAVAIYLDRLLGQSN